ncbi:hypothetical protein ACJMK2_036980 [Sinanodonta woodiana]|uniref:Uncharacterized protein n=1 Tax=Sinanodonta woodiana TaxID=1069815 RepID=A0ABD3WIV2_SINWO
MSRQRQIEDWEAYLIQSELKLLILELTFLECKHRSGAQEKGLGGLEPEKRSSMSKLLMMFTLIVKSCPSLADSFNMHSEGAFILSPKREQAKKAIWKTRI